jgi:hypothetical protein
VYILCAGTTQQSFFMLCTDAVTYSHCQPPDKDELKSKYGVPAPSQRALGECEMRSKGMNSNPASTCPWGEGSFIYCYLHIHDWSSYLNDWLFKFIAYTPKPIQKLIPPPLPLYHQSFSLSPDLGTALHWVASTWQQGIGPW